VDIIVIFIVFAFVLWFTQNFFKARAQILADRELETPVLRFETVDTSTGSTVILVYNDWTGEFIGQGISNHEILDMVYDRFKNKIVKVTNGEITFELNLTSIPADIPK